MTDAIQHATTPAERERIYRRNFFAFFTDGVLFTVAMSIMGTTTVIPDFVRRLTSSEILIGMSGSLFEVGWLLPQLFVARYIVGAANKKWWFIGPNIPVRFVVLFFGVATVALGPERLDAILVLFFVCYGIAAVGDGIVGVPWADLSGTSMSAKWRARTFGLQTATAGAIMLLVAPLIERILGDAGPGFPANYAVLFIAAGLLFVISNIPTFFIRELPGGKPVEKLPSIREYLPQLGRVLRTDRKFGAVLATRMLTSLFAMAGPFYVGFATGRLGLSSEDAVPALLAMQTLGVLLGALWYARIGARNNLLFIRLAIAGAAMLPVCAMLAARVGPVPLYVGFLISGVTLGNLFLSFHQYVITHAPDDARPLYAGLFNTAAAVTSLTAPLVAGTIAERFGHEALFAVALVMAGAALFVSLRYLSQPEQAAEIAPAAA